MLFRDLYHHVLTLGRRPEFEELCAAITRQHHCITEIQVHRVAIDADIVLGYVKFIDRCEGRHEDADTLCSIRVQEDLDSDHQRFVATKELMHAFDEPDEKVDDAAKFLTLMKEFEQSTLREDVSPMLSSEWDAEWMALVILCPKPLRDIAKAEYEADPSAAYEIALKIGVPETYIDALASDYYDRALSTLLERGVTDDVDDGPAGWAAAAE